MHIFDFIFYFSYVAILSIVTKFMIFVALDFLHVNLKVVSSILIVQMSSRTLFTKALVLMGVLSFKVCPSIFSPKVQVSFSFFVIFFNSPSCFFLQ